MNKTIHPASRVKRHIWLDGELVAADDQVATETPVAMVYNGISHVVMMSTPCDLEDFVTGFSLSEGIITGTKQLLDVEEITTDKGIELHATITAEAFVGLKERRRNLVGRTGCGLCGAESLDQAIPRPITFEIVGHRFAASGPCWQWYGAYRAAVGVNTKLRTRIRTIESFRRITGYR